MSALEFDTVDWRKERDKNLRRWLLGNEQAVEVVKALSHVSETWDDLIDNDKPASAQSVNQAFLNLLVHLPANGFWQRNGSAILPTVTIAINAWFDANELEHETEPRLRELAFYLRNLTWEVASLCVYLVGGWAHLRSVSLEMRRFFVHESYSDWEHRHVSG